VTALLTCAVLGGFAATCAGVFTLSALYHVYFNRENLPDSGPFTRFEFPTIGHIYDANGRSLIELAREHRQITQYDDIPPIVRDAILATEDKHFFSHNGVDYLSIPACSANQGRRAPGTARDGRPPRQHERPGDLSTGRIHDYPAATWRVSQAQTSGNSYQLRNAGLLPRRCLW
jgi:hypothetical protein